MHFPQSEKLNEIWSVLDDIGVPDEVVDHESQEFKAIYERVYMGFGSGTSVVITVD